MKSCSQVCIQVGGRLIDKIKYDYVLGGIEGFIDLFLDRPTKEVIKKYESNIRKSVKEEGTLLTKNFCVKVIGIKLFLLYQKYMKMGDNAKKRVLQGFNYLFKTIDTTLEDVKRIAVVRQGCVLINLGYEWGCQATKLVLQHVRRLATKIRQHKRTQTLIVYGNDIKELARIILQTIYQAIWSTIRFKRSRALYNRIIQKYRVIKTDVKQIREQSEIMSQQIQSEGEPEVQVFDQIRKIRKEPFKIARAFVSQDNLYQRRKDSLNESNRLIVEEDEDRSEVLETSKVEMDEPEQDLHTKLAKLVKSKIDSKQSDVIQLISSKRSSADGSILLPTPPLPSEAPASSQSLRDDAFSNI